MTKAVKMSDAARYAAYNDFVASTDDRTIPHCDSRILHHPDDCDYCDRPHWQEARRSAGIAHTGREPLPGQIPCEADAERPPGTQVDHRRWGGNKPTGATGDPSWPYESAASVMFYGDKGGRTPWPRPSVWTRLRAAIRRLM